MKKLYNYRILFVVVFLLLLVMFINAEQKDRKYYVFNTGNGKIYSYRMLQPGEKYNWYPASTDSFTVITRVIVEEKPDSVYSYQVKFDGLDKTISRDLRQSSVSRGLNGDHISSWNSFRSHLLTASSKLEISNTSGCKLLIKINHDGDKKRSHRYKTESSYIAYPPDQYDTSCDLLINDNIYTYYQGQENGIALDLMGPLQLKIINRLIVNEVDKLSFSWKAMIDGRQALYVEDSQPYSSSCLADSSSTVTQGLVNILQIPEGEHRIHIIDENPIGIIYRLYISKSALGK